MPLSVANLYALQSTLSNGAISISRSTQSNGYRSSHQPITQIQRPFNSSLQIPHPLLQPLILRPHQPHRIPCHTSILPPTITAPLFTHANALIWIPFIFNLRLIATTHPRQDLLERTPLLRHLGPSRILPRIRYHARETRLHNLRRAVHRECWASASGEHRI